MIVLDTNVLSEAMKPAFHAGVREWLSAQPPSRVFVTAISQAELLYGVWLLPRGRRRLMLEEAVSAIFEHEFAGRILPFDSDAARAFASIMSQRRGMGRPMSQADAQIAGIALSRNAAVATRNVNDFSGCGVPVINPWQA